MAIDGQEEHWCSQPRMFGKNYGTWLCQKLCVQMVVVGGGSLLRGWCESQGTLPPLSFFRGNPLCSQGYILNLESKSYGQGSHSVLSRAGARWKEKLGGSQLIKLPITRVLIIGRGQLRGLQRVREMIIQCLLRSPRAQAERRWARKRVPMQCRCSGIIGCMNTWMKNQDLGSFQEAKL